jgi:two-component system NtrC family response regulator
MVHKGIFREDLLFRLQAMHIHLPPLRERMDDLSELVRHFADKACQRYGFPRKQLNNAFLGDLLAYPWPGNVRELLHVTDQSVIRGRFSPELLPEHLPSSVRVAVARSRVPGGPDEPVKRWSGKDFPLGDGDSFSGVHDAPERAPLSGGGQKEDVVLGEWKAFRDQVLDEAERTYLIRLLAQTGGDVSRASKIAGVSRQRLYTMLRKHGISRAWRMVSGNV